MDQTKTSELDWLWLCSIPGLYEADRKRLLQVFQSPQNVRASAGKNSEMLGILAENKRRAILEYAQKTDPQEAYHKCAQRDIKFISCLHRDYPQELFRMADYPSGLFYRGRLPRREEACVAVIGARMCTCNGRNTARQLGGRLAACRAAVVSGMAYGIDSTAQEACLAAGGSSFGVLGCGADICYPEENRALYQNLVKNGGVISEFPPGVKPLPFHFPMRNRIISGLSRMVVVVEARKKSGTLITADLALEQGKDVYAFPGRPKDVLSEGCNRLIQQGAGMITDIDEFLEENGLLAQICEKEKNYKEGLATSENLVYSCLDSEPKSVRVLADETGMPVNRLMSALGALQLKGFVAEIGKNQYGKIR